MVPTLTTISQAAIAFLSLFGGFMKKIAPPEGAAKVWTGVASLMAGIGFLAVKLLAFVSPHSSPSVWSGVAAAVIAASIVLFFVYDASLQKRTVLYDGAPRIAGHETEYSEQARDHLSKNPTLTRERMLYEFTGNAARVWPPQSLRKARLILGVEYALFIAFLAFGLNLGVEVLSNTWSKPPPQKTPSFKERTSSLRDVHFASNASDLGQDAGERLSDHAAILIPVFREFPKATLLVEGYCDDQGSDQYNFALGYRRAESVRDFLVRKGLPADRIRLASHGRASLSCREPTEPCRQTNRRVQLTAVE